MNRARIIPPSSREFRIVCVLRTQENEHPSSPVGGPGGAGSERVDISFTVMPRTRVNVAGDEKRHRSFCTRRPLAIFIVRQDECRALQRETKRADKIRAEDNAVRLRRKEISGESPDGLASRAKHARVNVIKRELVDVTFAGRFVALSYLPIRPTDQAD